MVNKCSAPDCKSGYKNGDFKGQMFMFPTQQPLRSEWIRATPRTGFVATKNSRLCSLHFETDDFVADRTDSHKSSGLTPGELSRIYLKPNVVPHIWPNCRKYMSKETAPPRGKAAISESRIQNELKRKREKGVNPY